MRRSLFTLQRLIAVAALALAVAGATGMSSSDAWADPQTAVLQSGPTRLTAAADNGRMVVITRNTETGATRTTTYNSDGSSKTVVTQPSGTSTTTCNDENNQPIPCP